MTRINIRLLITVAVAVLALGGGVHLLHGYQVQRNADAFLREARRASERGQPEIALQHLQRYVRLAPHDLDGLAEYASQLEALGQWEPALRVLERVLRHDPDRRDARKDLVALLLRFGRHADARRQLQQYLIEPDPAKRSSEDGKLLVQLALCYAAEEQFGTAVDSLTDAYTLAPHHLELYQHLAALQLSHLKSAADACHTMELLVDKNPKDHRAHLIRGEWLLEHGNDSAVQSALNVPADLTAEAARDVVLQKASEEAQAASRLADDSPEPVLLAIRCATALRRLVEARELGQRALQRHPNEPLVYSALADIELADESRAEAISWLEQGLAAVPGDRDLRWNLANLLIESDRISDARKAIKELRAADYPKAATEYLSARLLVAQGQWLFAAQRFESVRAQLFDFPDLDKQAHFWLGKCHQQIGNSDQQLSSFQRAVRADAFWLPARLGLAEALVAVGRISEAEEEYNHAVLLPGAPVSALITLARLRVILTLRAESAGRDWTQVSRTLDLLEQNAPDSPHAPILRAEVLLARGEAAAARQLLEDARRRTPDALELWSAEIALAQRMRDWSGVEQLLEESARLLGDRPALRLAKGRYLVQRHGIKAADELKKLAQASEEWQGEDAVRLADGMATFFAMIRDYDRAAELWRTVAEAEPNNLRVRLMLFDLAFREREPERMQDILNQVRGIEGQGPLWRYGEAVRLSVLAQDKAQQASEKARLFSRSMEHLAAARIIRPAWARIPRLLGEIHDLQGDFKAAVEAYKTAIELGERDPDVARRTVALLFEYGRYTEADRLIRQLQTQRSPFSSDLVRVATEVSLRLEDFDRALELAQEAASASDRFQDHIWLGSVLSVLGRTEEAEHVLLDAVDLAPNEPSAWVSLVQFYSRAGQVQNAEAAVDRARDQIAPEHAALAIAQCYEALGRLEEAEAGYRSVVSQDEVRPDLLRSVANFYMKAGKLPEAERQLRTMLTEASAVEDADRAWARRNLAIILATRGGPGAFDEAIDLVAENLADSQAVEDRRAKAIILARRPGRAARAEAIALLEGVLAEQARPSSEDRYILAQLYFADQDWAKASSHLRQLLASDSEDARFVRLYLTTLLERGEAREAALWLDRLRQLAPHERATIRLQAAVLVATARHAEALQLLTTAPADSPSGDTLWRAARLEEFAHDLQRRQVPDSQNFVRDAEALYRRHASEHPDDALALAAFFARWNRIDEALALLAEKTAESSPDQIAATTAAILGSGRPTSEQLIRLESLLDRALREQNRPLPLLIASADLRSWQGDFHAAEQLYREVLRHDPANLGALNNLAMVLALATSGQAQALQLAQSAIELSGPHGALLDTRGVIHLSQGDAAKAAADFRRAIAEQETPERYLHLAQASFQQRQLADAKRALQKADELGLALERLHPLERPALRRLRSRIH